MDKEDRDLEETEEKSVWCFGQMDDGSDEEFRESCVLCDLYSQCFKETYGMTFKEWRGSEEYEEEIIVDEKLESFLKRLAGNKSNLLAESNIDLRKRKLIKVGKLSVGVTIPSVLNRVYPLGSEVYVVWAEKDVTILFFGEKSFADQRFIQFLKQLESNATFRTVNLCGKMNVLIIPRQFLKWFNSERKVFPKFSKDYSVLFFKSNLTDNELSLIEEKKRSESFRVRSNVEKAVSKKDEWVVEGSCPQCGKIGKLYNGKSGLVCSGCLRREKEGLF